jgi:hypothetical protein
MTTPDTRLIDPTMLFRFAVDCHQRKTLWNDKQLVLSSKYRLPGFGHLAGRPVFADVRAAWNPEGLVFTVRVAGKKQTPWCREQRIEESDGLRIWIDTRDTKSIHRASRFCHQFAFLPSGGDAGFEKPVAAPVGITRAREEPQPVPFGGLKVHSEKRIDGYQLTALIRSEALTGFDPEDHPQLGFSYAVIDREHGWQTFSLGPEYPFQEDPSLWGSLLLNRS